MKRDIERELYHWKGQKDWQVEVAKIIHAGKEIVFGHKILPG